MTVRVVGSLLGHPASLNSVGGIGCAAGGHPASLCWLNRLCGAGVGNGCWVLLLLGWFEVMIQTTSPSRVPKGCAASCAASQPSNLGRICSQLEVANPASSPCCRRTGCLRRAARNEHGAGEHPRAAPPVRPGKFHGLLGWQPSQLTVVVALHALARARSIPCAPSQLTFFVPTPPGVQMEDILFPILDKYTSTDGQDIFEEVSRSAFAFAFALRARAPWYSQRALPQLPVMRCGKKPNCRHCHLLASHFQT